MDGQVKHAKSGMKKAGAKKGEKGGGSIESRKETVPVQLKLRLFVGGLGPTVGVSDLQQRFAPLGVVHKIDLVPGKKDWSPEGAFQRGFAYVDFEASTEASLKKLFSAYNGCKWKGGVLRIEKAKEHYIDRLRREWVEAEAEAAAKAKIAEEAAAKAIIQSRPMYSINYEDVESPEGDEVELGEVTGEEDVMGVDADLVAAQIENERKGHLDLLSKLFPEDKDAGEEEEKVIEIVKLRAFPMPTDAGAKKRKSIDENPTEAVPPASTSGQPGEDCSGVASASKSKKRQVKFSKEANAPHSDSVHNKEVTIESKQKSSDGNTNGLRPILKKSQVSKKMDVDVDGKEEEEEEEGEEEEAEEEEEEEEEVYSPSSRSPSPEGGLSEGHKWERLFKYAGLKKGPDMSRPMDGVFTGISLDDDEEEDPAVVEAKTPQQDLVGNDGMLSGVLSEQEGETSRRGAVGMDGIFSGVLSEPEEEESDSPLQNALGSKALDSIIMKKTKKLTEEPGMSSDDVSDQGEETLEFEDSDENLQVTESDESSDSEMDGDLDSDMEDFGDDPSSAPKALIPTCLDDAAKASKWARMFESATNVAAPLEGVFSGSLDDVNASTEVRPAVIEQRMVESADANQTGSINKAPTASNKMVASDEEATSQSSGEEDRSTSSEHFTNTDIAEPENNHITDASGDEEDCRNTEQDRGTMSGNLLSRFNLEQDDRNPSDLAQISGAESSGDVEKTKPDPGKENTGDGVGLPSSVPYPREQNNVDDNTKWIQRASWKSLMGADGRAVFSLKQITGEPETTKATNDVKKTEEASLPEQTFGSFSFNFARNSSDASGSRRKQLNSEQSKKKSKLGSASDKREKPDEVIEEETGCLFMKSTNAEKEWRASKSELRIDSKSKHKAAVRKMKKMKGSGGAR